MKRLLLLLCPLLFIGSAARAIDPSEVILTVDGAAGAALGPQHFSNGYYDYGAVGMLEKTLGEKYSIGLAVEGYAILDRDGDTWGLSSLDLIGRRRFHTWHGFNPYLLGGLGGDLFKASYPQPFGDVFHAEFVAGSQYVFDTHWALDYAVEWQLMAPLNTPFNFAGARLGLSYRYGTQPHVNRIAPAPVEATSVEELSVAKVQEAVGKLYYTVKPGDSLYKIAGRKQTLMDPQLWPLIFDSNQQEIKDPNLIFPDEVITIRRHFTHEQAVEALKQNWRTPHKVSGTAKN